MTGEVSIEEKLVVIHETMKKRGRAKFKTERDGNIDICSPKLVVSCRDAIGQYSVIGYDWIRKNSKTGLQTSLDPEAAAIPLEDFLGEF